MIKKNFRKIYHNIIYKIQNRKSVPPSVSRQLKLWERGIKKRGVEELLRQGKLDRRTMTPIIIFQSGKVGSTSVHMSLLKKYEELGFNVPIFHAHVLEDIEQRIESIKKERKNPENSLNKLIESKELRDQIDGHPEWSWNVVSLVRDPVAIKVSAFFQLLDEYFPDWQKEYASGSLMATDLQKIFLGYGKIRIGGLGDWFDRQVKPIWDIDVYGTPFPKEKGYYIYKQNPKVNFMIVRLENLNDVAEDAFEDFLGIQNFSIIHANVGKEKAYSKLYTQFKSLPLLPEHVEEVYNSRYVHHFYTPDEISKFKKRWVREQ